jgi:hypothetical protein
MIPLGMNGRDADLTKKTNKCKERERGRERERERKKNRINVKP